MTSPPFRSEIRDSIIRELLDKVRKQNYGQYLVGVGLDKARQFRGGKISFDFPVTALIGPNGSGKSTILAASACAYSSVKPRSFFRRSRVGDDAMDDWSISYDLVDKDVNPRGGCKVTLSYKNNVWERVGNIDRPVKYIGIDRTVPASESSTFMHKRKMSFDEALRKGIKFTHKKVDGMDELRIHAARILGRDLDKLEMRLVTFTRTQLVPPSGRTVKVETQEDGTILTVRQPPSGEPREKVTSSQQYIFVGHNGDDSYSEFNFGAGESSIIRTVATMEALPNNSLVLVEEIENGLHPLATTRMVEYFVDFAQRKSGQVIFTTHSDYALRPLPSEAIWSSIDGSLQQGKLSIESLRAISGRVDKRLAVFTEDEFAMHWVMCVVRELLIGRSDEIAVYPVHGDGSAMQIHLNHRKNPAVSFDSICYLDGDSQQKDDEALDVFRLPGGSPELHIFNTVLKNLPADAAILTVALQRSLGSQKEVIDGITQISHTNRDPHLLFSQVGERLGLIAETIVRGAFLSLWLHRCPEEGAQIASHLKAILDRPLKETRS